MLLFTKGLPRLCYGDEQGFTGSGGDSNARLRICSAQREIADVCQRKELVRWRWLPVLPKRGTVTLSSHSRNDFRSTKHAAEYGGVQVVRYADESSGIFAVSRIDLTGVKKMP